MFVTYAPGDPSRLFIGERSGTIRILNLATGTIQSTPFLSIPNVDADGEGGLLGMTFHPDFQTNGKFYVNVTIDNGGQVFQNAVSPFSTQIREYTVSANPNVANTSFNPILSFLQPQSNHNAGWIGFNPPVPAGRPQYLYIPTGDGGGAGTMTATAIPLAPGTRRPLRTTFWARFCVSTSTATTFHPILTATTAFRPTIRSWVLRETTKFGRWECETHFAIALIEQPATFG